MNSIAPAMTEDALFNVLTEDAGPRDQRDATRARCAAREIANWVGFLISPAGDVSSGNVIILNQGRDVR